MIFHSNPGSIKFGPMDGTAPKVVASAFTFEDAEHAFSFPEVTRMLVINHETEATQWVTSCAEAAVFYGRVKETQNDKGG